MERERRSPGDEAAVFRGDYGREDRLKAPLEPKEAEARQKDSTEVAFYLAGLGKGPTRPEGRQAIPDSVADAIRETKKRLQPHVSWLLKFYEHQERSRSPKTKEALLAEVRRRLGLAVPKEAFLAQVRKDARPATNETRSEEAAHGPSRPSRIRAAGMHYLLGIAIDRLIDESQDLDQCGKEELSVADFDALIDKTEPFSSRAERLTDEVLRSFYRAYISEFSTQPLRKLLSPAKRKKLKNGKRRAALKRRLSTRGGKSLRESMEEAYEKERRAPSLHKPGKILRAPR